jgi:hypothetical protein
MKVDMKFEVAIVPVSDVDRERESDWSAAGKI